MAYITETSNSVVVEPVEIFSCEERAAGSCGWEEFGIPEEG
jgi:hypothetical protein